MRRRCSILLLAASALVAGCTSTQSGVSVLTDAGSTTTVPSTTSSPETTTAVSTTAPGTSSPSTTTASGACPGSTGIPTGANVGATIHGDVDGDLQPDTITEYSLDGVPHVHSTLATGGQSDATVQIGFGDHVSISFEDFDHSAGAANPPPVAVLAIGATKAGTADFTFLTNDIHYCIQPWHRSTGEMFVGRIAQDGPYQGLLCDGAAGSIHYILTDAQPDGAGHLTVTQTPIRHNFTRIDFQAPLPTLTVPDNAADHHLYGDISNCDHPPLFP